MHYHYTTWALFGLYNQQAKKNSNESTLDDVNEM